MNEEKFFKLINFEVHIIRPIYIGRKFKPGLVRPIGSGTNVHLYTCAVGITSVVVTVKGMLAKQYSGLLYYLVNTLNY